MFSVSHKENHPAYITAWSQYTFVFQMPLKSPSRPATEVTSSHASVRLMGIPPQPWSGVCLDVPSWTPPAHLSFTSDWGTQTSGPPSLSINRSQTRPLCSVSALTPTATPASFRSFSLLLHVRFFCQIFFYGTKRERANRNDSRSHSLNGFLGFDGLLLMAGVVIGVIVMLIVGIVSLFCMRWVNHHKTHLAHDECDKLDNQIKDLKNVPK